MDGRAARGALTVGDPPPVGGGAGIGGGGGADRCAAGAGLAFGHTQVLLAAMQHLAASTGDALGWPASQRRAVLTGLDQVIDALGAVRASILLAATIQVRQADELDAVPDITTAVTQGLIGPEHAKVIARIAATGTPPQREAATSPTGQKALLDLATTVDAGTFKTSADRWAATIDPSALERDHQAQRVARYLTLTHTPHGTHLRGLLDTFTGRKIALALEAATPKPGPDDDRTPEQRRADALDILADHVLTDPTTKPGAHVPPQITLILTEHTWLAAQAERDRQRATRTTTDPDPDAGVEPGEEVGEEAPPVPTTVVGYEPATWEDGTPLPASELGVAMCECELTRVVIDAHGEPLDPGRTQRLFTGAQRRAVIARDRECAWPHCHGPARWAHIHHLDWWNRDTGHTSVERCILLCTFHHHEVHRRDLTITRHTIQPRTHLRATMARVWYQFHEPNGHTFGRPPDPDPDPNRKLDEILQPTTGTSQPACTLT